MSPTQIQSSIDFAFSAWRSLLRAAIDWLDRAYAAIASAEETLLGRVDPITDDLKYLKARIAELEAIAIHQPRRATDI